MSLVYNNIIFESIDVTQYNDEDFVEVFVMEFRPWIRKNHGDEVGEYPMSLLVNVKLTTNRNGTITSCGANE